jgi:two-component sensor histidine kinase
VQILINVRSGQAPFQTVSMTDILTGQVDADMIRDRIVIIGITSLSAKDLVNSAAVNTDNPGLFFGVEMHAHVTSQIVSAVLDNRPLLRVWLDPWEYLWIVLWGAMGMVLVRFIPRPAMHVLSVGLIGLGLLGFSLVLLWLGWWLPVMPTLVAFTVNGLILPVFYLYDQTLRSRIAERQRVIEETYDSIHNGPLQTLALLLRQKETLAPEVSTQLSNLNQELREVYNRLQQESLPQEEQLQLGSQHIVDLRNPLHEVLYEVYTETLRRDFPGFDTIKFQIVKFEPFREDGLTPNDRRSLCRFLEEMLCNVGKHAVGAKRLSVLCLATETENLIRVEDNGQGASPPPEPPPTRTTSSSGRGTQQAQDLAQRLSGHFERTFGQTGTRCELRWPLRVPRHWWHR